MTQFAGFEYPKSTYVQHGNLSQRLKNYKSNKSLYKPSSYFKTEPGTNPTGKSFYLESDFHIGLRWSWCDEVAHIAPN